MTSFRPAALAAGLAVTLFALPGCSSSAEKPSHAAETSASATPPSGSPSGDKTASSTAMIMIKSFAYTGATTVPPGTKITVMNRDSEAHTVTADTGAAFDVKIDPGGSATFTAPSKPGTYAYHCTYHANMHGTLRVG